MKINAVMKVVLTVAQVREWTAAHTFVSYAGGAPGAQKAAACQLWSCDMCLSPPQTKTQTPPSLAAACLLRCHVAASILSDCKHTMLFTRAVPWPQDSCSLLTMSQGHCPPRPSSLFFPPFVALICSAFLCAFEQIVLSKQAAHLTRICADPRTSEQSPLPRSSQTSP